MSSWTGRSCQTSALASSANSAGGTITSLEGCDRRVSMQVMARAAAGSSSKGYRGEAELCVAVRPEEVDQALEGWGRVVQDQAGVRGLQRAGDECAGGGDVELG
jgi:hypothetical protein